MGDWRKTNAAMGTIALITGLTLVTIPSLIPFSGDAVPTPKVCLPIVSGWSADKKPPSSQDFAVFTSLPIPYPGQLNTQAKRAAYAAEARKLQTMPAYRRVAAWTTWATGPGACVPESRHRLILSAWIALGVSLMVFAFKVRRRLRPSSSRPLGTPSESSPVG
jgi:hypothetical protein